LHCSSLNPPSLKNQLLSGAMVRKARDQPISDSGEVLSVKVALANKTPGFLKKPGVLLIQRQFWI
jgi:hypothetical protein